MGMGFRMAFEGGLSFNLGDVIIPEENNEIQAQKQDEILENIIQEKGKNTKKEYTGCLLF